MELYLIRHAQSQNNALPESQRVEDPAITDLGVQQAAALAERLRDAEIDVLLVSAFRRALQTMQAVATARNQSPKIRTDLFEQGGCYRGFEVGNSEGAPGMNRAEINAEFPDFEIPDDIGEDGWWRSRPFETWDEAIQRAKLQVGRLIEEFGHTNKIVACVIHADFKSMMVDELVGGESRDLAFGFWNTSVSHYSIQNGQVSELMLNDTTHLSSNEFLT